MAMADDTLVADLLLSLKQPKKTPCLNIQWTVRQRRTRWPSPAHKKPELARASPTTPLSWSASAGAAATDGYEESSRPTKPFHHSRSKVGDQSETAPGKKRKKRTLPELLEEEKMLLKERKNLKNELAALHVTVEKHRATNESLKRIKVDMVSQQTSKTTSLERGKAVLEPPQLVEEPSKVVEEKVVGVGGDESLVCAENASSIFNSIQEENINQVSSSFMLPDLNLPFEEEADRS
ncbi:hypothetical protein SESBI_08525 [Sesbania bispinosa]|nr:hypothetical protein SESBI_08525 [Sesbania bispinosa]